MAEEIRVTSAEHLIGEGKADQFDASMQAWQTESWKLYSEVGEYNGPVNWIANGLSQIVIDPKMWNGSGWVDEEDAKALAAVAMLGDQATLFTQWGKASTVAGESFLAFANDRWSMRSRSEIVVTAGRFYVDPYASTRELANTRRNSRARVKGLPQATDLWRFYLPSAEFSGLAATPPQAFLVDLEQLRLLRLVLNGKLSARLYMNGIWAFSQAVSLPTQQGQAKQSTFISRFKALVQMNMRRENGAADALPIFLQVASSEVGDVIKQYYPEVAIDVREAELRAEIRHTLRELLDLPVEAQTGLGEANHWGSETILNSNLIYSLMPRARTLINALSSTWYQDRLVEAKVAKPHEHRLDINVGGLQGEASSDEARQAYDRGAASPMYLRSRHRIPEEAKATFQERVQAFGWKRGNWYLALFDGEKLEDIDAEKAAAAMQTGAPGNGAEDPDRTENPGSTDSPTSEVSPKP